MQSYRGVQMQQSKVSERSLAKAALPELGAVTPCLQWGRLGKSQFHLLFLKFRI